MIGPLYNALRLVTYQDNRAISSGTGFFWQTNLEDGYKVSIVTNKHVIEGAEAVVCRFHVAQADQPHEPSGAINEQWLDLSGRIVEHPDADLVAINISDVLMDADRRGDRLVAPLADASNLPGKMELRVISLAQEVLMVGCPNGLFDTANDTAIMRRGITATPYANNYCGREEFLVDMACFPGSSGSPVWWVVDSGEMQITGKTVRLPAPARSVLLGVLYAGPTLDQHGHIVMGNGPTVSVAAMMHLGQVIRSTALLAIDDLIQADHLRVSTSIE